MMTPEERLARLEAKMESLEGWLKVVAEDTSEIKEMANKGRGAIALLMKIGIMLAAGIALLDYLMHKVGLIKGAGG